MMIRPDPDAPEALRPVMISASDGEAILYDRRMTTSAMSTMTMMAPMPTTPSMRSMSGPSVPRKGCDEGGPVGRPMLTTLSEGLSVAQGHPSDDPR
ncbi:Uncharacterised protein [Mycobacteroides abscessus subsp. abscessus]|nr:Uncharacterised protein [Mycobacteroides abscessus subsp. abscessus]